MQSHRVLAVLFALTLMIAACGDGEPVDDGVGLESSEDEADGADEADEADDDGDSAEGEDASEDDLQFPDEGREGEDEPDLYDDEAESAELYGDEGYSNEDLANLLALALRDGSRDDGFTVAQDAVLDFFDPWTPNPDATVNFVDGEVFDLYLGPGFFVTCTIVEGLVDACEEVPHGEPEDEIIEDDLPEHGGEEDFGSQGYARVETIAPEPGGADEVREGGIVRGEGQDLYLVQVDVCCTGETLNVSVASPEGNASFFIYAPDGTEVAADVMDATIILDQPGEYSVEIGSQRGNAEYTLFVNIAVNAS